MPEGYGADADANFRQRSAAALTHPATFGALALLLLNDLILKPMWPDAWVTGKLSDLAFVVFASPLLAFFLALAVRGSVRGARVAFVTAYVGLPLLYATFNTFATVHEPIVDALSLANGSSTQSPLDVTDSIVIPPAMALAMWVWRRPGSAEARRRLVLVVAGLGAIASLGSLPPEPTEGVRFNQHSVETPRGVYSVAGSEVLHEGEAVYSTAYLAEDVNIWLQLRDTIHLEERTIATRPYGITFDPETGSVVVGLGVQGVLIGTPDGDWVRRADGPFRPTDFSSGARLRVLLGDIPSWVLAFALAASALVVATLITDFRLETFWMIPAGLVLGIIPAVSFALILGLAYSPLASADVSLARVPFPASFLIVAAIFTPFPTAITALVSGRSTTRGVLQHTLGIAALGLAVFAFYTYASYPGSLHENEFVFADVSDTARGDVVLDPDYTAFFFATIGLVLAIAALATTWRRIEYFRAVGAAFMVALAAVFLAFLWWLQLGAGLTFAKVAAGVLVTLVAVVLGRHLRALEHPEDTAGGPAAPRLGAPVRRWGNLPRTGPPPESSR